MVEATNSRGSAWPDRANAQMDLFAPILSLYAAGVPVSNEAVYRELKTAGVIPKEEVRAPVGKEGVVYSLTKRKVRWWQQSLRALGLLERVPGARGVWRATDKGRSKPELTPAPARVRMLGFSTELGVALWADSVDVFSRIDEPIHLVLTSLPYPLARPRAYGGPTVEQYSDWTCRLLEPIVGNLVRGGTIALNLGNDVFMQGSPARALYRETLLVDLHRRLGLFKLDEIIWVNKSKAPGPIQWASKHRYQLQCGFEPVYTLTNDPLHSRACNQRVLRPHTDRHKRLLARGGEQRHASYGDGANRLRPGAFGQPTAGAIPRNVIEMGHRCASQTYARKQAQAHGLPVHGAMMPRALAQFLIEYLTEVGDLVVDCCAGWFTTADAAEVTGRRWIAVEKMLEYVLGGSFRFEGAPGFERHLDLPRCAV